MKSSTFEQKIKEADARNEKVKQERDEAIEAICAFAREQDWAAEAWKRQPHIKRLFDIAASAKQVAEGEQQ